MNDLPPEYAPTVFLLEDSPGALPDTFAIITAWNPGDERPSDDVNEAADKNLCSDLVELAGVVFRMTGCSPDLRHQEPGWGAAIHKAQAVALGRKYRQRGIWWIADGDLLLLDCDTGREERVASLQERLAL